MKFSRILASNDFSLSVWSGGSTNQLFIYPTGSTVEKKDFEFRLSSAVIEDPQSEFSNFAGFTRHITSLDNQIELIHEGQYNRKLERFEVETFSGSWKTRSIGKCTDFNLIHSGAWAGEMRLLNGDVAISAKEQSFVFVYTLKVETSIKLWTSNKEAETITIKAGEILVLDSYTNQNDWKAILEHSQSANVIICTLKHN